MLVTEAWEQYKDTCITEIVELTDDRYFPGAIEKRIGNRSYSLGNFAIEPSKMFDEPFWWILALTGLALFSPNVCGMSSITSSADKRFFGPYFASQTRKVLQLIPAFDASSWASSGWSWAGFAALIAVAAYQKSAEFLMTGCLIGFILVALKVSFKAIKSMCLFVFTRGLIRRLMGTIMLIVALSAIVTIFWFACHDPATDPLGLLGWSLGACAMGVAALFMMHFRFAVFRKIASSQSVSALGLVLSLVTFSTGFLYEANKTVIYVDPNVHTVY